MFESFRKNALALRYPVVFTMRRYLMVLILTVLPRRTNSQIFGHMLSTILVISYIWSNMPFENQAISIQEMINELLVVFAAYPLLFFTDWVWELEIRANAGWTIVACIIIIAVFNITFIVVSICRNMITRLRLYYKRKKMMKEHLAMIEKRRLHEEEIKKRRANDLRQKE